MKSLRAAGCAAREDVFGRIFDAVVVADGECREFVAKHEQPFAWGQGRMPAARVVR